MHRYSGRLYRVAYSVLLDAQRAEAVVLEAFLAAFGDLSRYEPTGKFAAWLTRLAYQQARAQRAAAHEAPEIPLRRCERPRRLPGSRGHPIERGTVLGEDRPPCRGCSSWRGSAPSASRATHAHSCLTARC